MSYREDSALVFYYSAFAKFGCLAIRYEFKNCTVEKRIAKIYSVEVEKNYYEVKIHSINKAYTFSPIQKKLKKQVLFYGRNTLCTKTTFCYGSHVRLS